MEPVPQDHQQQPTPQSEAVVRVRYKPAVAWAFVALGGVNLLLGGQLLLLGQPTMSLWLGVLVLLIGWMWLRRPYFLYSPTVITRLALVNSLSRRFVLGDGDTLVVEGGRRLVLVRADGGRQKLSLNRSVAHTGDWQAMVAAIAGDH